MDSVYLSSALDQLGAAIDHDDVTAAEKIFAGMLGRDPVEAKEILHNLIAAGVRRLEGR